ncbi:MAG: hypothetical protein SGJ09_03315 [Phycisphaerae bacterium]|nr:hypothetical protein [Phycisphaerae bacterium]
MILLPQILACALTVQQGPIVPPQSVPPSPGSQTAPASVSSVSVDDILASLEKVGAEMKDFQAKIIYETFDDLTQETSRRFGTLVLDGTGMSRRFAIVFEKMQVISHEPGAEDKVRSDSSRDHWIYSDGWLTEINLELKSVIKRQVMEPGKQFDPLKLGEGPFPLPIGQPKAAVLEQFDVTLCEMPPVPLLTSVTNVDGLKLVPKPGTAMAKDYADVRVFYSRAGATNQAGATHDPALRAMYLTQPNKNTVTVLLNDPKINAGIDEKQRELLTQPDLTKPEWDPKQWAIDIRPLKAAQADNSPAKK